MISVNFRAATLNDLAMLASFEQGVITAERPFSQTLKTGPITYYDIPDLIRSQRSTVLMILHDGQPIGCGYARILDAKPHFNYSQYAYLGFMYVLPAFRGQGIVARLIDALCNWAQAKGVTEIQLEVYNDNDSAVKAYAKSGFKPDLITMRKRLPPK